MRLDRSVCVAVMMGSGTLLFSGLSGAQEDEDLAPAPNSVEPTTEEPEVSSTQESSVVWETAAPTTQAAPEAPAVEETPEAPGWNFLAFADAYGTYQSAQAGTAVPSHRAFESVSPGDTNENGFSLNFMGIDLGYEGKNFGLTTSVRAGPGVVRYYGLAPSDGIIALTQAFVTWKPSDSVTIDAGQFGTIFGAEVAESWMNLNYTRGALYFQMQPFWHTGVRGSFALTEEVSINAMLVNDVNQISLNPDSKLQGAVQVTYTTDEIGVAVGTLQTLGEGSTSGFDRFFDAVFTYNSGPFSLVFNGDLNFVDSAGTFYGLSLAAGYRFLPEFGVALRGEFIDLDADSSNNEIYTGTLTLDTLPVPGVENLVVRWDNRIEASSGSPFFNGSGDASDVWLSSTLGVVVHTDGLF